MASELAKAYVQIIPTAEGIQGNLEKLLGPEAEKVGKSAGARLSGALGGAMKVAAAGVAAASAALVKVGKDAVAAYADFEQLVGGVETLFGESADQVQSYAAHAFETAGLSANQYMETVTSFSASLLQSLGGDTAEAARIGDMAITDMADNSNKMGSSMESIQNAYQGFAKQNYTMLDNLKLGYGGTKEEMERLLADATALSGVEYDISSLSDVYQAIHVIQDELGIVGTTAKEAGETISGSLAAMRAAWSNLLVGVADDNADITALVDSFVDSAVTAGENIIPRAEAVLGGLGDMLTTAADRLVPIVVDTIIRNLPAIVESGVTLVGSLANALISALPELAGAVLQIFRFIANGIQSGLPNLAQSAIAVASTFGQYLEENIPKVIEAGLQTIKSLTSSIRENAAIIIDGAISLALSLAKGLIDSIPAIIENVPEIVSNIANVINDNAPKVLLAGWELIKALIRGLLESIPVLIENIPKIAAAIWDTLTAIQWVNLGGKIVSFISQGIGGMLGTVLEAAKSLVKTITDGGGLIRLPQMAKTWGRDLIQNFIQGIKDKIGTLKTAVKGVASTIKSFIGFSEPDLGPLSDFHTFAPDMMELFAKGIHDNLNVVRQAARDAALSTREGLTPTQNSTPATAQKTGSDAQFDSAALALAIRHALDGCGVYMDGDRVGRLVTRGQSNTARAYG